jgi:hypothetical protein
MKRIDQQSTCGLDGDWQEQRVGKPTLDGIQSTSAATSSDTREEG